MGPIFGKRYEENPVFIWRRDSTAKVLCEQAREWYHGETDSDGEKNKPAEVNSKQPETSGREERFNDGQQTVSPESPAKIPDNEQGQKRESEEQ